MVLEGYMQKISQENLHYYDAHDNIVYITPFAPGQSLMNTISLEQYMGINVPQFRSLQVMIE